MHVKLNNHGRKVYYGISWEYQIHVDSYLPYIGNTFIEIVIDVIIFVHILFKVYRKAVMRLVWHGVIVHLSCIYVSSLLSSLCVLNVTRSKLCG